MLEIVENYKEQVNLLQTYALRPWSADAPNPRWLHQGMTPELLKRHINNYKEKSHACASRRWHALAAATAQVSLWWVLKSTCQARGKAYEMLVSPDGEIRLTYGDTKFSLKLHVTTYPRGFRADATAQELAEYLCADRQRDNGRVQCNAPRLFLAVPDVRDKCQPERFEVALQQWLDGGCQLPTALVIKSRLVP